MRVSRLKVGLMLDWVQENLEVVVTIGSALVAMFSALLARGETRKQRELQTETLRQQVDAASLQWGNAAIDVMGRAAAIAENRNKFADETAFQNNKANMLAAISALVERGRMFFPNYNLESKGAEKDSAYQGHRPPILDALMWVYYELSALTRDGGPTGQNSAEYINDCRRLLVSELQAHLDPRRRNAVIGRYDNQDKNSRDDSIKRANALKGLLHTRRPGINIDGERRTTTQTETVQ